MFPAGCPNWAFVLGLGVLLCALLTLDARLFDSTIVASTAGVERGRAAASGRAQPLQEAAGDSNEREPASRDDDDGGSDGDDGDGDDEEELPASPVTGSDAATPASTASGSALATPASTASGSALATPASTASGSGTASPSAAASPPATASGSPPATASDSPPAPPSGTASGSAPGSPAGTSSTSESRPPPPPAAASAVAPAAGGAAGGGATAAHPVPAPLSLAHAGRRNPHAGSSLWIRTFYMNEETLNDVLLRSLRAFWPPRRFGRVYLVFDSSDADRAVAQRLLAKYGGQELLREEGGGAGAWRVATDVAAPAALVPAGAHMNDPLLTVTYISDEHCNRAAHPLCNLGYHRQQYDTVHADENVPERFPGAHGDEAPSDVIGIADSDAILTTLPHDHTYFDEQGRPRVIPRVGLPIGDLWSQSARATLWLLNVSEPARGMSYFPVYFKRPHFAALRAHAVRTHGGRGFNDLWQDVLNAGYYSQFNFMVAFVWAFHRDEYSWHWHTPSQDSGQPMDRAPLEHHEVVGLTHDFSFLDNAAQIKPYPRTFNHWRHHRWKGPPDEHMTRGFCNAVRAAHAVCRAPDGMSDWDSKPWHGTEEPDLWDFEYSTRGGPAVAAAQAEYYDLVRSELDARADLWPVEQLGDHLLRMRRERLRGLPAAR